MSFAIRFFAVLAAAMLGVSGIASAQSRAPTPKAKPLVTSKLAAVASSNAAALAQALAGAGVTISNATLRGAPEAAGTFSGAIGSIGINTGVVLSTGNVGHVVGPNEFEDTTTDFELEGDSQLDDLVAPYITYDAVILEFDLTTAQSTIGIRFVFASEEYNEFVGSPFNDVVAIFVNGVNCANFNGRPVAVNSINADVNPTLFVDNTTGTRDTEMDGMTVPLECVASVTPNAPNHVRIAIADTSDGILDAAIFLAAGGVRAPGNGPPTTSNIAKAIEYYHPEFNHYFITAIPDEITKLDNGTFKGWVRTGLAFNVFISGVPNTAVVCRFFSTAFGLKSSHFYTPDAPECAIVKANPNWQFEGEVFNVSLSIARTGACQPGTQPLYRMYNNGEGDAPNHRYTTEIFVRELMLAQGWIPEGDGIGVIACVPT